MRNRLVPVYTYHKSEIDDELIEVDDDFWPSVNAVIDVILGNVRPLEVWRSVLSSIEGFHVTSYQANFASHPSRDGHVCFLLHSQV